MMLAACSASNGEPQTNRESVAPSQVSDFDTLYAQNCAGCHGAQGRGGASISLTNPVYLAVIDETKMRTIVANGVRGTSMPAFAQLAGGMLTEQQIEVITSGIFSRWGRKQVLDGANPPSYAAKAHPATVLKAGEHPREALSRMILSWRWSVIRHCARS
jgi:mono/diheme cytochrome c family protein